MSAPSSALPARAPSFWLFSPALDAGLIYVPVWIALGVALALPAAAELPVWGYIAFVLAIDVAHVYASLYRTYLVPGEVRRRPWLYLGTPLAVWIGGSALYAVSSAWFWTGMAYLAAHHFIRQQSGIASLYRLREGLSTRSLDARVERWAFTAVTGFPLLWWHAHLPREFHWFIPGDFFIGLPVWALWPAGLCTLSLCAAHIVYRVRSRRLAPGRDLWWCTTAACWFGGIVFTNGDFAFTLTNVVLHGLPYIALVTWSCQQQWAVHRRGPLVPEWFAWSALPALIAPLLLLALAEEALWDWWVWQDHPWFFGPSSPPDWIPWVAAPLLSVPQVTHYILDGFIWRMREDENPGLHQAMAGHSS